jgi:hypothetical protein
MEKVIATPPLAKLWTSAWRGPEVLNFRLTTVNPRVHASTHCRAQDADLRLEQTVTSVLVARRWRPRQPKAVTTNRVRDYRALEREYITGDMSLRGLCRAHGVTAHSAVMVQARREGWAEERRAYRSRASATFIQHHADRAAAREAEVRDHAIEAIDEAITRFRADLRATEKKLVDGEWVEVPLVRMTPRDLAFLIDRMNILFGRPGTISEGRSLAATATSEALPVDLLKGIIEMTRGLAGTPRLEASLLPRPPTRVATTP